MDGNFIEELSRCKRHDLSSPPTGNGWIYVVSDFYVAVGKAGILSRVMQTFIYEKARDRHANERARQRPERRSAFREQSRGLGSREPRNTGNTRERCSFPRNVVRTEFYGSVLSRAGLLHRSFLFAPGKYLTPVFQAILTGSLVFLSIAGPEPKPPHPVYTVDISSSLCSRRADLPKPLFRSRAIANITSPPTGDISIECRRAALSRSRSAIRRRRFRGSGNPTKPPSQGVAVAQSASNRVR